MFEIRGNGVPFERQGARCAFNEQSAQGDRQEGADKGAAVVIWRERVKEGKDE